MSTRRLALVKSAEGPWIPMHRLTTPYVKIVGLVEGAKVHVELRGETTDLGYLRQSFESDGCFRIERAQWAKVSCEPKCVTLICEIVSEKVA